MQETGKIILLNGASGSGKSSLARGLQERLDEPFWHFSIDHLQAADILPRARIESGEFPWQSLRARFFEGFHRCLPALATAGNNLIVEHIVETEDWMRRLVDLLGPFDVFFVGVHCPLPELERRERQRGDRRSGTPGTTTRRRTRLAGTTSSSRRPLMPSRGVARWRSTARVCDRPRLAVSLGGRGCTCASG